MNIKMNGLLNKFNKTLANMVSTPCTKEGKLATGVDVLNTSRGIVHNQEIPTVVTMTDQIREVMRILVLLPLIQVIHVVPRLVTRHADGIAPLKTESHAHGVLNVFSDGRLLDKIIQIQGVGQMEESNITLMNIVVVIISEEEIIIEQIFLKVMVVEKMEEEARVEAMLKMRFRLKAILHYNLQPHNRAGTLPHQEMYFHLPKH